MPGQGVVLIRNREDVEVAVAVDVRRVDGRGPIRRRDRVERPEVAAARVPIPDDAVRARRGREHVAVAVPVEVGDEHVVCAAREGGQRRARDEARGLVDRVVAVPGDRAGVVGGGHERHVAVAVHVRRGHRRGGAHGGGDGAAASRQSPSPPTFSYQAILSSLTERGEDVDVAVAVHVRRDDRRRAVGGGGDGVQREGVRCLPSFSYQAILSSVNDAESTSMSPSPSTSAAYTETALRGSGGDRVRACRPCHWLPCSRTRRSCRRRSTRRGRRCRRRRPRPPQTRTGHRRRRW